ncbi:hypothetical protein TELCIR_17919 [Teladorsagia circumcincta]|uniref:Uncharacterized protein n=1 Tax=Teladorsagia circumcincta TaxID=45464 RepID=A0A2G9TRD9_TELCI|nr:hypothetical protein TELCIR_17919 [Teladorsagia circumcincta]
MAGPLVDLVLKSDKPAALEALRNLWSYRLLEVGIFMSRKRTIDAPSCSRDVDEGLPEPLVKMPRPLRRSRSIRAMAAPVVDLAYQLADMNAEAAPNLEMGASDDDMVMELGQPGADRDQEVEEEEQAEEAAGELQEEVVVPVQDDSRISNLHPSGSKAVCVNPECAIQGIPPKRCKAMKRTAIHFLNIEPQLALILDKNLSTLVRLHRDIHCGETTSERSESNSFPLYKRSIETLTEFDERKIKIVLTLNFDGVKLKKLSRSEAWPIYIRLEGLPFKEKNKIENIILAGITFTRKTPTEKLLTEMFGRLRQELAMLSENGIPIVHNDTTWFCTPVLANGVIDFAEFYRIIATTRNYTYADKFILGLEDFSCTTGSEKDALSFVVFPLAAAMNICADPVGGVAVLAYWILVRAIERSSELSINDFVGIQELARGMKYLWYAVEPTLFTLKLHVSVIASSLHKCM